MNLNDEIFNGLVKVFSFTNNIVYMIKQLHITKQFTYDIYLIIYKISMSYSKPIEYFNQW